MKFMHLTQSSEVKKVLKHNYLSKFSALLFYSYFVGKEQKVRARTRGSIFQKGQNEGHPCHLCSFLS